jgi:hypothetical protein
VLEIASSHAIMLSRPIEVANFIEAAARSASRLYSVKRGGRPDEDFVILN